MQFSICQELFLKNSKKFGGTLVRIPPPKYFSRFLLHSVLENLDTGFSRGGVRLSASDDVEKWRRRPEIFSPTGQFLSSQNKLSLANELL